MKKVFLAGGLLLMIAVGSAIWKSLEARQMATRNMLLEKRITELENDLEAVPRNAKPPTGECSQNVMELMRLRNEVTQLRGTTQELGKVEAEKAQLLAENTRLRSSARTAAAATPALSQHPGVQVANVNETSGVNVTNDEGDSVALFRENPRLMKRYLPELYQQEVSAGRIQPVAETRVEGQPQEE